MPPVTISARRMPRGAIAAPLIPKSMNGTYPYLTMKVSMYSMVHGAGGPRLVRIGRLSVSRTSGVALLRQHGGECSAQIRSDVLDDPCHDRSGDVSRLQWHRRCLRQRRGAGGAGSDIIGV